MLVVRCCASFMFRAASAGWSEFAHVADQARVARLQLRPYRQRTRLTCVFGVACFFGAAAVGHSATLSPPAQAPTMRATVAPTSSASSRALSEAVPTTASYCGESGRYASLPEARDAMLAFIGKAWRCEAIAIGDWAPAGSGGGYSPDGACSGRAFRQSYSLCGSGELRSFTFFESGAVTAPVAVAAVRRLPVPKLSGITNTSGVPQKVVLVNASPMSAMAR